MRTNLVKIHNHWRRIMRMAKTEELRRDLDTLRQGYERPLDRKEAIIQVRLRLRWWGLCVLIQFLVVVQVRLTSPLPNLLSLSLFLASTHA